MHATKVHTSLFFLDSSLRWNDVIFINAKHILIMQNNNEQKLKPHMIAFVDFMGTRETVKKEERKNQQKKNQLFELLLWVHNEVRKEGYYKTNISENGGGAECQPTVTSFSDNIVITIPISDDLKFGYHWDYALSSIQQLISMLFFRALENGFLIRGAIDVGELYHADHMVFGEALINAYEHERKAFYPRVILTDNCLAKRQDYQDNVLKELSLTMDLNILDFRNQTDLTWLEQTDVFKDFDGTLCMRFINKQMYGAYIITCCATNLPKDVQESYQKKLFDFDKCISNIEQIINNCNDSYLRKNWEWMNNYIKTEKNFFEIFKQHHPLIKQHKLEQQKKTSLITD
jgi:hypothetical protein